MQPVSSLSGDVMEDMTALLDKFLSFLLSVFPKSPFRETIDNFAALPFLGYLNWFMPVAQMLGIGLLWLTAIGLYYVYSVIARWVKLIA